MIALYIQVVPPPVPPPPPPGLSLDKNLVVLMFAATIYAVYIIQLKRNYFRMKK